MSWSSENNRSIYSKLFKEGVDKAKAVFNKNDEVQQELVELRSLVRNDRTQIEFLSNKLKQAEAIIRQFNEDIAEREKNDKQGVAVNEEVMQRYMQLSEQFKRQQELCIELRRQIDIGKKENDRLVMLNGTCEVQLNAKEMENQCLKDFISKEENKTRQLEEKVAYYSKQFKQFRALIDENEA